MYACIQYALIILTLPLPKTLSNFYHTSFQTLCPPFVSFKHFHLFDFCFKIWLTLQIYIYKKLRLSSETQYMQRKKQSIQMINDIIAKVHSD